MDGYRINCAVAGPASCGLLGVGVGVVMKVFGVKAFLTPMLLTVFAWWPTDLLYSGALIGVACGTIGALFAITADISREATIREMAPRRH